MQSRYFMLAYLAITVLPMMEAWQSYLHCNRHLSVTRCKAINLPPCPPSLQRASFLVCKRPEWVRCSAGIQCGYNVV